MRSIRRALDRSFDDDWTCVLVGVYALILGVGSSLIGFAACVMFLAGSAPAGGLATTLGTCSGGALLLALSAAALRRI